MVAPGWGGGSCGGRAGLTTTEATAGKRRRRRPRVCEGRGGACGWLGVGRRLVRWSRGIEDPHGERGRGVLQHANARSRIRQWLERRPRGADDPRDDSGRAAAAATACRWGSQDCAWSLRGGAAARAAVARG